VLFFTGCGTVIHDSVNWSWKDKTSFLSLLPFSCCLRSFWHNFYTFKPDNDVILTNAARGVLQFSTASWTTHVATRMRAIQYFLLHLIVKCSNLRLWSFKTSENFDLCNWHKCQTDSKKIKIKVKVNHSLYVRLRLPDFKTIGTWRW
jgi:hypothetical protein